METIQTIESQLNDIENQKKELLLKDLFLKSKLILEFLKIDEFIIEKQDDILYGEVFADIPISSIIINHKDEYYDFNNILEKLNLSIADLELGSILKKKTKITTDMSFDQFKENVFSVNKKKNKNKVK